MDKDTTDKIIEAIDALKRACADAIENHTVEMGKIFEEMTEKHAVEVGTLKDKIKELNG